MGSLKKILRSVPGIDTVERQWFSDVWVTFNYKGIPCVVWEPFGDNSELWVGPGDVEACTTDFSPVEEAFRRHRGPALQFLARVRGNSNG